MKVINKTIVTKNNLDEIKLSASTIYKIVSNKLFLKCLRTNKEIVITGNVYHLNLLLNNLLSGSKIVTIKNILNLFDQEYFNQLEDGGFLE